MYSRFDVRGGRQSRIGNLKTIIKNQLSAVVGLALILGLAHVGARAEDTSVEVAADVVASVKKNKPERPERPEKPANAGARANVTELKEIIRNFQEQKKEFLKQQKEQQGADRGKVREQIGTLGGAIQDAKESIAAAKRQAQEQARKVAEEAKESAKE